ATGCTTTGSTSSFASCGGFSPNEDTPMKLATWGGGDRFSLGGGPGPPGGGGEVVVDVQAAGICGTDVHATQGLFPWSPPMVLGHEYTGVVEDVGRGVRRKRIGRAVHCE